MSQHTGSTPDTERAADWRDAAACLTEDPELFFPKGDSGPWLLAIEQAKAICRRCPVADACLRFAFEEPAHEGIYGGLTEQERAGLRRAKTRQRLTADHVAARVEAAREPAKPRTMQSVFDENTVRVFGGHLEWTGLPKLSVQGQSFTAKQLAFALDRGRYANGRVFVECGVARCVLPEHLADQEERDTYGTRAGATKALAS